MFGDWILSGTFQEGIPYPHVVIENMFSEDIFQGLCDEFGTPEQDPHWKRYWNPLEKKYALNVFDEKPITKSVFEALQSPQFVARIAQLTGIVNLQSDPYLHGAGLHYHPRGGKLDMHLDYSVHPFSGLERRVNLICYLNPTWEETWGGALELWDSPFTHPVKKVLPLRNRAILFQTSDISYHGIPKPIGCPEGIGRKSLAIYYLSPLRENSQFQRAKAMYRPLPDQPVHQSLKMLYEIRSKRLITPQDLWKTWESDGQGYW